MHVQRLEVAARDRVRDAVHLLFQQSELRDDLFVGGAAVGQAGGGAHARRRGAA